MNYVRSLQELPWPAGTGLAVAVGVFDGVHRGHQRILHRLRRLAAATGARAVAVTFEPHPRAVLNPHNPPQLLTPLPLKARLLLAAGAEAVVVLPFSHELAFLKPAEFLQSCLLGTPFRLEAVCVGAGWRFGHLGAGDTRLLRHFGREHGFAVAAVRELHFHNGMVSSTRIRKSLREGRLRFAARLLGRPYAIEGEVVHGRGAGGPQLDCHTANVDCNGQLLPPHGVYAARAVIEPDASPAAGAGPRHQPAIAYIGTARTLAAAAEPPRTVLECHLFDYDGTLYGRRLAVELLEFVRPDQVFPTVATLRGQIASDLLRVREITHAWHAMNKPDVPRVV